MPFLVLFPFWTPGANQQLFFFFCFSCPIIMWNFSCSLVLLIIFKSPLQIKLQKIVSLQHSTFLFFHGDNFTISVIMLIDIHIYTNKYIFKRWQWKVFLENEVRFGFLVNGRWSEQLNISPVQVLQLLVGVSTLCNCVTRIPPSKKKKDLFCFSCRDVSSEDKARFSLAIWTDAKQCNNCVQVSEAAWLGHIKGGYLNGTHEMLLVVRDLAMGVKKLTMPVLDCCE